MESSHTINGEEDRIRTLLSYGILDSQRESGFDRIVTLASDILKLPIAAVAFFDRDRYWLKSSVGLERSEWPRHCQNEPPDFMSDAVIWVGDALAPGAVVHPPLAELPTCRFIASVPIICPQGRVLGRLIVGDPDPRPSGLSPEERAALLHLQTIAKSELALRPIAAASSHAAIRIADTSDTSLALYHQLFLNNSLPMWIVDRSTLGFLSVNLAATAKLGWTREEFFSLSLNELADRPDALSQLIADAKTSVLGHVPAVSLATKDRHVLSMDLHYQFFFSSDDQRWKILVTGIDVTERRVAEAALTESREALSRALLQRTETLNALPVDIGLLDAAGRVIFINRNWQNYLTPDPQTVAGSIIGENYIEICEQSARLYDGQGGAVAEGIRDVLEANIPFFEHETSRETVPGLRWFRTMITPLRVGGRVDGAVILHIDTTDTKRAIDAIQAANFLKSQFLANTSHELRTPLNAIIGFSELIKLQAFGEIDKKYLEYVDYIHTSGHHLLEIINDLLDLSKIEAGQMELREDAVPIAELAQECIDYLDIRIAAGKLTRQIEIADTILIRCDRLRMKQIFLNLLSNAVKFTPAGGHVRIVGRTDPQSRVVVEIIDTGIGMNHEDARLAMEPFVQIHSPFTRQGEGTGLGLALVSRMVALHGGLLEIESRLGAGTTVRVTLPNSRNITPGIVENPEAPVQSRKTQTPG